MPTYEIAELNIGTIRGLIDSPIMADFVANLGRIYAMADASRGFVWRLQTDAGDATAIRPFENENIAINMSVWRDIESLLQFVYHSSHTGIMHRRGEWFERMGEDYMVLWWVPHGHRPTVTEAMERLEALKRKGPHAEAFTFRQTFPPPDAHRPSAP
jgi:hypothetical protein